MTTHPSVPRRRTTPSSRLAVRLGAACTAALLAAGLGALSAPAAFAAPAAPAQAAATAPTQASAPAAAPAATTPESFEDGRYIVTLRDDAVAGYRGGIAALDATRPAEGEELDVASRKVADYSGYLTGVQQQVADSVDASITTSYTITTNGFSSALTAAQASALAADPRVSAVVPDALLKLQATSSTDFLGLSGADGVWAQTGGVDSAGEGIVVGIIDSGIAPENASFAGEPLGTDAGAEPYLDGDTVVFDKADGQTFHGACETGEGFEASDCSTKLVTARYFVDAYTEAAIGRDRGEYLSPRDGSGHGSHTSSTAAGDSDVDAEVAGREFGTISGVVPGAKLAMYKACWTGVSADADGCQTGDLLAAIDAAVADGVDVINYSIGGGSAQTTISLTDQAFLNAAVAGVFVAASAGNDGPTPTTADNAAPWITTVAASTIPSYEATVRLGDGQVLLGGSITVPADAPVKGDLVDATAVALPDAGDPQLCGPDTLDPAKVAGKVVLCDRGVVDRVAKSAEVKRAGGIGVVMVNPVTSSIDLDTHSVPTVHLDAEYFDAVHAYAATAGATVTLEDGNTADLPSPTTPQVAGFSSRGPILADGGDLLKPDIAAPGVAILAAYHNAPGEKGEYALLSGTSMASPHVAGLAALYLGEHPDASPSEIKSAMMTTSHDTVDPAGDPVTDPFAQGAGQIDPTRYFDPGMLYLNDADDWYGYVQAVADVDLGFETVDPSELNLASISVGGLAGTETVTRTVTATKAGSFTAAPVEMPGVDVVVSPTTLDFSAAGEQQSYTVTFTRTDAPLGEFQTGQLIWSDGDETVTTPLAVRPVSLAVPAEVSGEGVDGSVDIPVSVGDTGALAISKSGLAKGQVIRGTGRAADDGGPVPSQRYVIDVPAGGEYFGRFVLDSADDTADLDLHLLSFDSLDQVLTGAGDSSTSNADEMIDAYGLTEGRYILDVDFFSGAGDLDFTLTSYLLGSTSTAGALTVTPETLQGTLGETSTVTAGWTGLEPGASYLGRVGFGDTGHSTVLTVTTPGTPVTSTAELAVTTDKAWTRAGIATGIRVAGLTDGEPYSISLDGDVVVTGVGGPDGTAHRAITLPRDLPDGEHTVTVESMGKTAVTTFSTANIITIGVTGVVSYDAQGKGTVYAETEFGGAGELQVSITGSTGVVLDERLQAATRPDFYNETVRTSELKLPPGAYTAAASAVAPDGSLTQRVESVFTVDVVGVSDVAITQNPDDENLADLHFVNRTDEFYNVVLRYKLCSGPVVFSTVWINAPLITQTFDMTAAAYVELLQVDGTVLTSYVNKGSARCAAQPKITQDFWATYRAGDTGSDTPLAITASNRYGAYSAGFDLSAGVGRDFHKGEFFRTEVPHPVVTVPGPVIDTEFAAPAGETVWTRAKYEARVPGGPESIEERLIYATPVTLDMLEPFVDGEQPGGGDPAPGDPGTGTPAPGDPGTGAPGTGTPAPGAPGQGTDPGVGGSASGDLASTGFQALGGVVAAILLLLGGGVALLVRHRRRRA